VIYFLLAYSEVTQHLSNKCQSGHIFLFISFKFTHTHTHTHTHMHSHRGFFLFSASSLSCLRCNNPFCTTSYPKKYHCCQYAYNALLHTTDSFIHWIM